MKRLFEMNLICLLVLTLASACTKDATPAPKPQAAQSNGGGQGGDSGGGSGGQSLSGSLDQTPSGIISKKFDGYWKVSSMVSNSSTLKPEPNSDAIVYRGIPEVTSMKIDNGQVDFASFGKNGGLELKYVVQELDKDRYKMFYVSSDQTIQLGGSLELRYSNDDSNTLQAYYEKLSYYTDSTSFTFKRITEEEFKKLRTYPYGFSESESSSQTLE